MAHDSLWVAYAKAHYPQQTYVALIRYFTEKRKLDKIQQLKQEAENYFNIQIEHRKFGQDNRKINILDNRIYQSLDSIKGINSAIGEILYTIKDNKFNDSLELYLKLKELGLSKTQIENLAKIGYFDFNKEIIWLCSNYKEVSQINKNKIKEIIETHGIDIEDERLFISGLYSKASKETKSLLKFDDKTSFISILMKFAKIEEPSLLQRYYWEMDLIGEIITENELYDFYKIEKYRENKGSLLLENPTNGMLEWFGYKAGLKFRTGDILAVGKKYDTNKNGWMKITQLINLSQLFR